MIMLKGFFRKKTTKIYLGILTILLFTILILFSFLLYYKTQSYNFNVGEQVSIYDSDINNSYNLEKIVYSLNLVCYTTNFICLIVFFVIIENVIEDDNKRMNINRLLGYTKFDIKNNAFKKIFVLESLAFLFATIFSSLTFLGINNIFKLNLIVFDYILLLKIYGIIVLLSILICLFKYVKLVEK